LHNTAELLAAEGYVIVNIDATVIAEQPRLSLYIEGMRGNIAKAAEVGLSSVSVKATTEEGLGFSGAGLGIAAHAVVLISRPADKD
jgi:2-C-methyl-D-erythritol 2,4-cyclodiphosphate synthase